MCEGGEVIRVHVCVAESVMCQSVCEWREMITVHVCVVGNVLCYTGKESIKTKWKMKVVRKKFVIAALPICFSFNQP